MTSQAESLMMHGSIKSLLQDLKNPNKAIQTRSYKGRSVTSIEFVISPPLRVRMTWYILL